MRMNTQACVKVCIHKRVNRVLTRCSNGGIINRRGVMENEHTGMCQCIHTHKSKESTYSL